MTPCRSLKFLICLALGYLCPIPCSIPSATAAESVAANSEQATSMVEKRRIVRERAKALAEFNSVPGSISGRREQEANKALEGILYWGDNDTWVKVGLKNIDWSGGQVDHSEWTSTLRRFHFIVTLASEYKTTHDDRYAQTARALIEDYIRNGPTQTQYTVGAKGGGGNTLDMAIRMDNWTLVLPVFLDSPSFDDAFLQSVIDSIAFQAWDLSQHLTCGNYRVAELSAVTFVALRLPFVEHAKELLDTGISGLRANMANQFLPDGVHIERTPSYHIGMAESAFKYVRLAQKFPEADAHVNLDILARALDYSRQSALSCFNDSVAAHRDPSADEFARQAAHRVAALKELFPGKEISPYPPLEQVFRSAGHVFARSEWKTGGDYLAFDAGTWGGGHCHLNRLAFTFRSGGRALIEDPGSLDYEMRKPMAIYGRSTPAHSTLNVNGLSQADVDAQLLKSEFTPETVLIHGRYQSGYWPGRYSWGYFRGHGQGVFGTHNRILFWVKGEYLVSLDNMYSENNVPVHNVWQMGPMDGWEKDEAKLAWWSKNKDANLFLQLIPFTPKVEMQCFEGSNEPLRGWVGKHWYGGIPAPQVEFRYPCVDGSVASAVLLVPYAGGQKPAYTVKRTGSGGGFMGGEVNYEMQLSLPNGGTDLIAWTPSLETPLEDLPSKLTTDGTLVWLRIDATGKPVKGFVLDGSFVKHEGRKILECDRRETKLFVIAP